MQDKLTWLYLVTTSRTAQLIDEHLEVELGMTTAPDMDHLETDPIDV